MTKFCFSISNFSKWIFIASCCFAVGGVIFLTSGTLMRTLPTYSNLFAVENSYDFGEVEPEESISHDFLLRNNGKSEVFIKEIKTSCGCTGASLKNNKIPPGQEEKITLWYDAPRLPGKITQWAVLSMEPPSADKILLKLNATVVERFGVSPNVLNFGIVDQKLLPITRKIRVFIDETQENINVGSFKALSDNENVNLVVSKAKSGYWVSAEISNNTPCGVLFGNIKFSLIGKKPIRIPIMGKIIGDFYAAPSEIYWNQIESRGTFEKKIKIFSRNKIISNISIDLMGTIKDIVEIKTDSANNEATIVATLRPQIRLKNREKADGAIKVIITDTSGGKHRLNVPITVVL